MILICQLVPIDEGCIYHQNTTRVFQFARVFNLLFWKGAQLLFHLRSDSFSENSNWEGQTSEVEATPKLIIDRLNK